MRRVARVAAMVMAAVHCVYVRGAAADWLEDAAEEPTFLFFTGGDLWREGGFLHGGVLWSPGGLEQEGFMLKFMFGSGVYRYRSGALGDAVVIGRQYSGSIMPGWRFKRHGMELTVFAGLDAQHHWYSPDDPSNDVRGTHYGLRAGFDFWYEPARNTMFAADASVSTISTSYNVHAAYGWRVFERVYLGPEAQALATDGYRQHRFGLHATAFRTETFEISAGAGYARDSDERSGAYGRLNLITRR